MKSGSTSKRIMVTNLVEELEPLRYDVALTGQALPRYVYSQTMEVASRIVCIFIGFCMVRALASGVTGVIQMNIAIVIALAMIAVGILLIVLLKLGLGFPHYRYVSASNRDIGMLMDKITVYKRQIADYKQRKAEREIYRQKFKDLESAVKNRFDWAVFGEIDCPDQLIPHEVLIVDNNVSHYSIDFGGYVELLVNLILQRYLHEHERASLDDAKDYLVQIIENGL